MKLLLDENLPKRLKQDFQNMKFIQFETNIGMALKMENS